MSQHEKAGSGRAVTAAERSALCRVAYDAWREECRNTGRVIPYGLPALYAPPSRDKALELLETHTDGAHSDSRTRFAQIVASFYARGENGAAHFDRARGTNLTGIARTECRCCHAANALGPKDSFWTLRHRYSNGALATFNPVNQVTEIRSTYYISAPKDALSGVNDPRVVALMKALAVELDPANWSREPGSSFKRSEPIDDQPRQPDAEWLGGWAGRLIESFEWNWNPDASTAIDNLLNIDYRFGEAKIVLDYSLSESLSSKLWLSRQAGGMDIDRGSCEVEVLGERELNFDPAHQPTSTEPRRKVVEIHAALGEGELKPSDSFNICVIASKTERFTPVQNAPSWLSTLINYMTPVLGGIWMSEAVQTSLHRAIAHAGQTSLSSQVKSNAA
jgi:hypothetical protein